MQDWSWLVNPNPADLVLVLVRTVVVYLALVLLLRASGKRQLGQMTLFDLVVLLVISNAVQNAMVGPDTSLAGGLLAAATLVGLNWLVDRLELRSGWFRKRLTGSPTLLIHDGQLLEEHLSREGIDREEVMQALREHGVDHLGRVKLAVLEVDGTISVVPSEAETSRTRRRVRARKPAG
jgi:uncharacterized membrane protein YcaP (DUF421 family)